MAEYIEREALIAELNKSTQADGLFGAGIMLATDRAIAAVQCASAADVVEVRHGAWVSLTDCANAGVYCSVCHKKVWKEDYAWCNRKNKLRSNYCPNCGARMDGVNGDG